MHRRTFLATLGSAALAGCGGRGGLPSTERDTDPLTPPPNVTVYTDARPSPEVPSSPDAESAREFVAAHEEALVYNELVGAVDRPVEVSGTDYPTSVEVEPATTQVVHEDDAGVYVLSSCSGEAEYYCEDRDPNGGCGRGAGRNAHAVTHFVGDGEHVRVPYNWYACEASDEPYAGDGSSENVALDDRQRAARLNLYDLSGWEPTVDVTVTHRESGDVALERTYEPSLALTVQPDVTRRKGTYDVAVDVAGAVASGEWTVESPDDPTWTGLCAYVTPVGEPAVLTVGTDGPIELDDTACRVRPTETD